MPNLLRSLCISMALLAAGCAGNPFTAYDLCEAVASQALAVSRRAFSILVLMRLRFKGDRYSTKTLPSR